MLKQSSKMKICYEIVVLLFQIVCDKSNIRGVAVK